MNPIETNPLVILLAGILTQALMWAASKAIPDDSKLRAAIPALATALAVGVVTAIQAFQGTDVLSWQTAWEGLLAGAMAVLVHSQGSQVVKARKAKQTNTGGASAALLVLLASSMLWVGCSTTAPRYPQLASASLAASSSVAKAAKLEAARGERLTACVTAAALETSLSSAEIALIAYTDSGDDVWLLPGVAVELGPCAELRTEGLSLLSQETASQVRATVEGLAPGALVVTRAVLASSSLGCEDLVIASAVLTYLEGSVGPVLGWLEDPGSPLRIPAVEVNLETCR